MGGATYTAAAQAEADKMFNFNFPEAKYGASGILFSSQAINASDVAGQASAVLPTELMFMFGKDEFRLSANCTAKLEISNVDVMLVLDVKAIGMAAGRERVCKYGKITVVAVSLKKKYTSIPIQTQ